MEYHLCYGFYHHVVWQAMYSVLPFGFRVCSVTRCAFSRQKSVSKNAVIKNYQRNGSLLISQPMPFPYGLTNSIV